MAKKDLVSKRVEDYNEVFADIYNTLLFHEKILDPERLRNGSTETVFQTQAGSLHHQSRDILKEYHDEARLVISSFGIENQASIDKNMPIRIMGYDVGTYRQQLCNNGGTLTPVITIVLNLTDKRWDAPKSIHEMLHLHEKLAEYVQDYQIYVFDIAYLADETIEAFDSDFQAIARFFKKKRLGKNPFEGKSELKHPQEILEFISAFTSDRRYLQSLQYLEPKKREGGVVTMCEVADALIARGMLKGKVELLYEMNYSAAEIAKRLNISEDKVNEILQN